MLAHSQDQRQSLLVVFYMCLGWLSAAESVDRLAAHGPCLRQGYVPVAPCVARMRRGTWHNMPALPVAVMARPRSG